eukprot:5034868-Pyramimonas_sp.AAC.1
MPRATRNVAATSWLEIETAATTAQRPGALRRLEEACRKAQCQQDPHHAFLGEARERAAEVQGGEQR